MNITRTRDITVTARTDAQALVIRQHVLPPDARWQTTAKVVRRQGTQRTVRFTFTLDTPD